MKAGYYKGLRVKYPVQPATPSQYILDLGIEVQRDVNGIEMGVLENGIPFLTQRGVAKISGAARSVIFDVTQEWEKHYDDPIIGKDRKSFLKEYLFSHGYRERKLYIETRKDGSPHYAYPDIVCMAIIEYYAFEAKSPNREAIENYRKLAAFGLQKFIYDALGYTPADKWLYHHERASILQNAAPEGYWLVFHEITGMIVDLINAGLTVNHKTIPDISVGAHWGSHWEECGFDAIYGARVKCAHYYPERFPQSKSNPQYPWAYPDESIAEFRRWLKRSYLPTKFPPYILKKAALLPGKHEEAKQIAALYAPKQIAG